MTLSLVSSETFINLIERKVDVAIRAGTLTDSSLRARPLFASYRKIIASPQYIEFTPRNLLINHIVRQTGDTVAFKTQLLQRLPAVGRQPAGDLMQLTVRAGDRPGIQ